MLKKKSVWQHTTLVNSPLCLKYLFYKQSTGIKASSGDSDEISFIDPYLPLDKNKEFLLSRKGKTFIYLDKNGLLRTTLKFKVSDAKKKRDGVTKERRFSCLYRVEGSSMKDFLANTVNNKESPFVVQTINQDFVVNLNGTEFNLEIPVPASFVGEIYLKHIVFSILEHYYGKVLPSNSGSSVANLGLFPPVYKKSSTSVSLSENVRIVDNNSNLIASLFTPPKKSLVVSPVNVESSILQLRRTERRLRVKKTEPATSSSPSEEIRYDFFNKLPIAINLLELNLDVILPTLPNKQEYNTFVISQAAYRALPQPSDSNFLHTLTIVSRETFVCIGKKINSKESVENSVIKLSYFENDSKYERFYVDSGYLAACLNDALYQKVKKLHSYRLRYTKLTFETFGGLTWSEDGIASKKDLTLNQSMTFAPNIYQVGSNSSSFINYDSNLIFTAVYPQNQKNNLTSSRFITCCALEDSKEVNDHVELLAELQLLLNSSIIINGWPRLILTPVFDCKNNFRQAEDLLFKGLGGNATPSMEGF
jgi:hypothetical protein